MSLEKDNSIMDHNKGYHSVIHAIEFKMVEGENNFD